eukprot:4825307-Pleurochrysis_carterae.AAC.2
MPAARAFAARHRRRMTRKACAQIAEVAGRRPVRSGPQPKAINRGRRCAREGSGLGEGRGCRTSSSYPPRALRLRVSRGCWGR